MSKIRQIITIVALAGALIFSFPMISVAMSSSSEPHAESAEGKGEINVKEIIFDHLGDSYAWHIANVNGHHVEVYLPIIAKTSDGWRVFSSKHLAHGESYHNLRISTSEKWEGKLVEVAPDGTESRPLDLSLTKNVCALLLNSLIMIVLFLGVARWYRRRPEHSVPGGFVGLMEMVVMYVEDEVIRNNVGPDYKRYSPYLLCAFFFILINNLLGLVPVFPFGANTTGNIAVTLVMALCTTVAVNVFGNKEYWKEIFWPEVPWWIKVPIPLMPVIEMFGIITKPFALTVRLFANIMAGHTIILALTCLIFITFTMGVGIGAGMTAFSVILSVFMLCLELLVAFIQAYVFTMLSAVFIGLSRQRHEHHDKHETSEEHVAEKSLPADSAEALETK